MAYNFKQSNWDENSVELRFYSHKEWREKDVVEICAENGSRIGYIMSASCIETDDEEILAKQHISKYVSRGIMDQCNISFDELCLNTPSTFLEENTCILFLHNKSLSDSGLDSVDLAALLVKLGFSARDKISSESFYTACSLANLQSEISNGKATIKKINRLKTVNSTIFDTYLDSLHFFGSPLTQFLMLYQYFEMFMGEIYMPRAKQAFTDLESGRITKNDFRTIVSSLSKETGLLSEALSGVSKVQFDFIDKLRIEAKVVSPCPSNTSELVYSIRNAIVHRTISFYNDPDLVKDINSALLWTIYDTAVK